MENVFSNVELRNPTLQVSPTIVALGDPHLGRVFKTGVPLERRGERELQQQQTFQDSLINIPEGVRLHVCMGDLFDEPRVSEETVLFAYTIYTKAAKANPDVTYVLIAGNHDLHRDVDKTSSFELLEAMLFPLPNVYVVRDQPLELDNCLFVPWQPFKTSNQFLMESELGSEFDFAFGHWDFIQFSESHDNGVPYAALHTRCKNIVTGHYHKRGIHTVQDGEALYNVLVTGSMLPYAHGEDLFDEQYKTLTLAEVETALSDDPEAFKDVVLRVQLKDNELPIEIKALALTFQKLGSDTRKLDVNVDEFSLEAVFRKTFKQHEVSEPLTNKLWAQAAARNL